MAYEPRPIDTSHLRLSPELGQLLEKLAENVHDIWAKKRMEEGWKWGPERNDVKKEYPGLVPYDDLSECEKEYDRKTAEQTLKAIIALGYGIS